MRPSSALMPFGHATIAGDSSTFIASRNGPRPLLMLLNGVAQVVKTSRTVSLPTSTLVSVVHSLIRPQTLTLFHIHAVTNAVVPDLKRATVHIHVLSAVIQVPVHLALLSLPSALAGVASSSTEPAALILSPVVHALRSVARLLDAATIFVKMFVMRDLAPLAKSPLRRLATAVPQPALAHVDQLPLIQLLITRALSLVPAPATRTWLVMVVTSALFLVMLDHVHHVPSSPSTSSPALVASTPSLSWRRDAPFAQTPLPRVKPFVASQLPVASTAVRPSATLDHVLLALSLFQFLATVESPTLAPCHATRSTVLTASHLPGPAIVLALSSALVAVTAVDAFAAPLHSTWMTLMGSMFVVWSAARPFVVATTSALSFAIVVTALLAWSPPLRSLPVSVARPFSTLPSRVELPAQSVASPALSLVPVVTSLDMLVMKALVLLALFSCNVLALEVMVA